MTVKFYESLIADVLNGNLHVYLWFNRIIKAIHTWYLNNVYFSVYLQGETGEQVSTAFLFIPASSFK